MQERCYTLQCFKKIVAALPQSLQKVEPDSTSCNGCCDKNIARLVDCVAWYIHLAISRATWVATKLRDKLRDKLHSVTGPLWSSKCPDQIAQTHISRLQENTQQMLQKIL